MCRLIYQVMDVALEISCPETSVQWLRNAYREIIEFMIPGYPMDTIYNLDGQTSNAWRDRVSTLEDLAGFRFVPRGIESTAGVRVYYLNVYTTEKAMTSQTHVGCFAHLDPFSLGPKDIANTISKLESQNIVLKECYQNAHVGAARLEARVSFADAPLVLMDIPEMLTQRCIAVVPPRTLW